MRADLTDGLDTSPRSSPTQLSCEDDGSNHGPRQHHQADCDNPANIDPVPILPTRPEQVLTTSTPPTNRNSLAIYQLGYPTLLSSSMRSTANATSHREHLTKHREHRSPESTGHDNATCFDRSTNDSCVYRNRSGSITPMTLVETVSFNTSDISETFLTCPTCLCNFDEYLRTPKLLPCSHTICHQCLLRILQSGPCEWRAVENGRPDIPANESFRCPVCRKAILLPRGGLDSLPPSYLINRLLDLLRRKEHRELVPKCGIHSSETILFCETCDNVFCNRCAGDSGHKVCSSTSDHVVVPFSLAIKRVNEILNYKESQCSTLLDEATVAIRSEMQRLDSSVLAATEAIWKSFEELQEQIESRKCQLIGLLNKLKDQKMMSLAEQLNMVQEERTKLNTDRTRFLHHPDIRELTDQVQILNSQLESSQILSSPRENSFLKFEFQHNDSLAALSKAINLFGRIRVSNTYPPLCTALIDGSVAKVRCTVSVTAIDYHGNIQNVGGDPLSVVVSDSSGKPFTYNLSDTLTGSYDINFLPEKSGVYQIDVKIFNRPIRGSPLSVYITDHNNPVWVSTCVSEVGSETQSAMPVGIVCLDGAIVVLDSRNQKIAMLSATNGRFENDLCGDNLISCSTTGLACLNSQLVLAVDWKSRQIVCLVMADDKRTIISTYELCHNYQSFNEPVSIMVTNKKLPIGPSQTTRQHFAGQLIVVDSGDNKFVCFDLIQSVGEKKITGVYSYCFDFGQHIMAASLAASGRELFVAGSDRSLYSLHLSTGRKRRLLRGCYTALVSDPEGRLLTATCNRRRRPVCVIQVFDDELNVENGPSHCIDSHDLPLRRPMALAVDGKGHVFSADPIENCVKKYRYV